MSIITYITVLLGVAFVHADPIIVGVQQQPDLDDGYFVGQRPGYASYYPQGYAAPIHQGYAAPQGYGVPIQQGYYGYYPAQVRYVQAVPQQQASAPAYYAPVGYLNPQYVATYPVAVAQQQRPAFVVQQQPVVQQTAVLQQQPVGVVQSQASAPTQIYKPAPSPPVVVNPSPVVVRPPPPPPIYVQPQKIFVQPPQVPPVYASNPQVYYAQGAVPGAQVQQVQPATTN